MAFTRSQTIALQKEKNERRLDIVYALTFVAIAFYVIYRLVHTKYYHVIKANDMLNDTCKDQMCQLVIIHNTTSLQSIINLPTETEINQRYDLLNMLAWLNTSKGDNNVNIIELTSFVGDKDVRFMVFPLTVQSRILDDYPLKKTPGIIYYLAGMKNLRTIRIWSPYQFHSSSYKTTRVHERLVIIDIEMNKYNGSLYSKVYDKTDMRFAFWGASHTNITYISQEEKDKLTTSFLTWG